MATSLSLRSPNRQHASTQPVICHPAAADAAFATFTQEQPTTDTRGVPRSAGVNRDDPDELSQWVAARIATLGEDRPPRSRWKTAALATALLLALGLGVLGCMHYGGY